MNISLTKELEELVSGKVESGRYHSASEVVREGLRLLEEQDMLKMARLTQLKQDVQIGVDQMNQGEYTDYDEKGLTHLLETIKKEG